MSGWSGHGGTAEIEGRLRAASQALLERFPDAALSPLRLPAEPARARVTITLGRRAWRRGRPWLIPLAAAAVLAAVTLSSALSRGLGHSQAVAAAAGPEGTPPYYLQAGQMNPRYPFNWNPPPDHLLVRSTATGKTVAAVTLPHSYASVAEISGAADDHTFALAVLPKVGSLTTARIFVLHFDPSHLPRAGVSWILWKNSTGSVAIVEAAGERDSQLGLVLLSPGHSRLLTSIWESPLAW